jgi:uncharacterized protein YsxB (DUF464 family)
MATQTPPLRLTRDQLASFLQDHQQIRAFENLFSIVEDIAPDVVQQVLLAAGSAQAAATDAQGQVQSAEQALGTMLAVCEAKATLALQQVLALKHIADFVETAPPPREFKRSRYGSFYDTTTQTATVINTATAITFNTTDLSRGVTIGSPTSRVYVDTEGIYNFQTSIQLDSTVATDQEFYLWFRKNGADVTNSASQVRVKGNNAEVFLALNYFFDLKAGDYVELMFSVTNLGVQLLASGPVAPHPGIPSIILTVANNIGGVES